MWTGDARVARVATDLAGGSLEGMRVLDLACDEGNFANEVAEIGAAEVVGIEVRDSVYVARERARVRHLENARFEQGDVRNVTNATHGTFDIVLCLGIMYHLDTPAVFDFAHNLQGLVKDGGFALIETQIALKPRRTESYNDRVYRGKSYTEDVTMQGASIDNPLSFWPTRPSLMNLLSEAGFTSVLQVAVPAIPVVDQLVDHVVLAAFKGIPHPFDPTEPAVWAERRAAWAHPTQGLRWRLLERLRRLGGRSRMRAIFRRPG